MRFFKRQPAKDDRYALMFAEAVRALSEQQDSLDQLRTRVGVLLSAATIGTSFLGGIAFDDGRVSWPGVLAILLFVAHMISGFIILWPRDWTFQMSANTIEDEYIQKLGMDLPRLQRNLALHMEDYFDANAASMRGLFRWYEAAIALVGLEIVAWLGELGRINVWLCAVLCG